MTGLAVGQRVILKNGPQTREATVLEITDDRTNVEPTTKDPRDGMLDARYYISFSNLTGEQLGTWIYFGPTYGWGEYDQRPAWGDYGPWELDLAPLAGRESLSEREITQRRDS